MKSQKKRTPVRKPKQPNMQFDKDAFASGQVISKLWLIDVLERTIDLQGLNKELKILTLGGWYGILHFMLRCRKNLKIESYRSLDIDESACEIADVINETWVWQNWKFKSIVDDANTYTYDISDHNTVINTSVEHMESRQWFENIPYGALVILQSNDMPHDDHSSNHSTLEDFVSDFKVSELFYSGQKLFQYDDANFKRFMIIGKK